MPILIAVVAVLAMVFAFGLDWNAADESTVFIVVAVVVVLFLVLFFLPYLREFNRSEAERKRIRQFRKRGRKYALQFMAGSLGVALLLTWYLRDAPSAESQASPAPVTVPVVASATSAPARMAVTAVPAASLPKPKAAPRVLPASAPVRLPSPLAAVVAQGADAEVQKLIAAWSKAWSDGDVDAYLAAYSTGFTPADGSNRKAWEAQRRQRVEKGRGIVVRVADLQISGVSAGRATAVFTQHYSARGLEDLSRKTLQLEQQGGRWRIVSEQAVALPKSP